MTNIFDVLERQLQNLEGGNSSSSTNNTSDPLSGLNGIPSVAEITVATFNHYDNGKDHKTKWSSSRFTMNLQFFTQTEAFTPREPLAAWKGTVQLLDPGFWISYVDVKHEEGKIDADTYAYLKAAYRKTMDEYPDNALIGTFTDKSCGTNYSWPYFLRFYYDRFEEPNLEVWLDEMLPKIDVWETVKTVPGKPLPIIRSRYNPHNLWKPGRPMGGKGRKH
ncbi:hypothetical protein JKG68_20905 [Microvirga aerilata]|uniref:Uncharacterized protein n=1 Tax=Microvirga aerilata TaxID=670292 RepID=A0A936ZFW2_9HYPH|nr:hypothetical protein [Microvirga aerilata]MBL0406422.1 hypothetical protein [Microvirga aerilata]